MFLPIILYHVFFSFSFFKKCIPQLKKKNYSPIYNYIKIKLGFFIFDIRINLYFNYIIIQISIDILRPFYRVTYEIHLLS